MSRYTGQQPWEVTPDQFPVSASSIEQLVAGLSWAVLAPSGHNTQPWLFHTDGDGVEVIADRSKGLAVVDSDDRELTMGCAAAVTNLRVALRRFGRDVAVKWFPNPTDADVVARVSVAGEVEPSTDDIARFDAITDRLTNRAPFTPAAIPDESIAHLRSIANRAGARLEFFVGDMKPAVADLIAEGDRQQMADKAFRRELAAWVHPNRTEQLDGMRGYGFSYSDLASHVGPHIIRNFDVGKSQAAKDHKLASNSPALVVIATDADTRHDWVIAGKALAEILLQLTADGLAASFLNQPIEVPELRGNLAALLSSDGMPQLLLRLGSPTEQQPHTPRIAATARLIRPQLLHEAESRSRPTLTRSDVAHRSDGN